MPQRTCLVTGQKAEQSAFFRFTIRNGQLVFDNEKSTTGRGGYVCKSLEALRKLPKMKGKICHFLKIKNVEISSEVLSEQEKLIT